MSQPPTYTTLDRRVIDLRRLTEDERAYLDACRDAAARLDVARFANEWVNSPRNPVLKQTEGWLTRDIWNTPLYQILWDMQMRLEVAEGSLRPEEADFLGDPWGDPLAGIRAD